MATKPFTEIELVRAKTTDDEDALGSDIIAQFLLEYNHKSRKARVLYAAADCLEYMIRELEWNNIAVNDRKFSENLQSANIDKYRAMAAALSPRIF